MNSGTAGTAREQSALNQSDYFQRDHQAASASRWQKRQFTSLQIDNQVANIPIPRSNPSTPVHGTSPSTSVQQHFVPSTPDFNALIKRERFEEMERESTLFGTEIPAKREKTKNLP